MLIRLDLGAYCATRRLLVPTGITFKELHQIIQVIEGTTDTQYRIKLNDNYDQIVKA